MVFFIVLTVIAVIYAIGKYQEAGQKRRFYARHDALAKAERRLSRALAKAERKTARRLGSSPRRL